MKKKILFIHPFLPYPLTSGGHQALYNGIKAVADYYDVSLVFEGEDIPEMRDAVLEFSKKIRGVHVYPLLHKSVMPIPQYTTKQKLYIGLRNLYHKFISQSKKVIGIDVDAYNQKAKEVDVTINWKSIVSPMSQKWINHIFQITRKEHFDLIQIEMPRRIPDIFSMPGNSKIIHVHHELGFVRRELEIKDIEQNGYITSLKKFCDFNEIAQLNMYDAIITLSSTDSEKLSKVGVSSSIYTSFAVVDTSDSFIGYPTNNKRLTFIGPDKHEPNVIGINWFLTNCWGKLKEKDSSYTLDIIGKWGKNSIEKITKKYCDVKFLGFVEDLHDVLQGSVMIVPITIGSGIRMKILEAASNGIPFVSTFVGAEGIPVRNGEHCFLTNDANVFIDNIIKLQDIELQKKFIANSLDLVKKNYSFDAFKKNRLQIYEEVLSK